MRLTAILATAAAVTFLTQTSYAQTLWNIKTPNDNFTIETSNNRTGKINGQDVSLAPLAKFIAVFGRKFAAECGKLPKAPSITVTQTRNQETKTWHLYTAHAIFSDGANCTAVEGAGLDEFPVHRSWFLNQGSVAIDLGNRFTVEANGTKITFVNETGSKWQNADSQASTNWTLVDNFVNAAKSFEVAHRTTAKPAANAERFVLRTAKKVYRFYRVGDDWGVDLENPKWLAITPSFNFMKDASASAWQNEENAELAQLKKVDAPAEERLALMKKLTVRWNDDIKRALQEITENRDDNAEVRRQAVVTLKYHPTDDSIHSIARALLKTDDPELLFVMTDALRVRNRKGPRINPTDRPEEIEKKVQEWQKWVNELRATPSK